MKNIKFFVVLMMLMMGCLSVGYSNEVGMSSSQGSSMESEEDEKKMEMEQSEDE